MKKDCSLLALLLLLGSVRVFAAQTTTDYDHSANFSQYKTYSWLKVQAGDSLWEDRIQQDVDAQLAAKGWTKVPANGNASAALANEVTAVNILGRQMANTVLLIQALGGRWDRSSLPERPECCGSLANSSHN